MRSAHGVRKYSRALAVFPAVMRDVLRGSRCDKKGRSDTQNNKKRNRNRCVHTPERPFDGLKGRGWVRPNVTFTTTVW